MCHGWPKAHRPGGSLPVLLHSPNGEGGLSRSTLLRERGVALPTRVGKNHLITLALV